MPVSQALKAKQDDLARIVEPLVDDEKLPRDVVAVASAYATAMYMLARQDFSWQSQSTSEDRLTRYDGKNLKSALIGMGVSEDTAQSVATGVIGSLRSAFHIPGPAGR